jgi:hypothetical protein
VSAQILIEISTRKCFWGVYSSRRVRLTTSSPYVSRLSWQCLILNISQPYVPLQPGMGIAIYLFFTYFTSIILDMLYSQCKSIKDRLCAVMAWVTGYRSRGPGYDSRRYHIIWDIVGQERAALSFVSTTEEVFGRNSSGSGLEIREYGLGIRFTDWATLYPHKLAITSPTSGGRSVGIRSLTKATVFVLVHYEPR